VAILQRKKKEKIRLRENNGARNHTKAKRSPNGINDLKTEKRLFYLSMQRSAFTKVSFQFNERGEKEERSSDSLNPIHSPQ